MMIVATAFNDDDDDEEEEEGNYDRDHDNFGVTGGTPRIDKRMGKRGGRGKNLNLRFSPKSNSGMIHSHKCRLRSESEYCNCFPP